MELVSVLVHMVTANNMSDPEPICSITWTVVRRCRHCQERRDRFAAAALTGILAEGHPAYASEFVNGYELAASDARKFADALIAELDERTPFSKAIQP
jgi:hypothetical protein